MELTYARAGVDIAEADRFVRHLKRSVRSTYSRSVVGDVGAFGGFFRADFRKMKHPVLVSSVDGVGTKLMVAQMADRHDTIGQDLVNHCVNDIAVCGARPLFFLDYFATGKLRPSVARGIVDGLVAACKVNKCSLIGGETAEMPGMYGKDEYDLAGTVVGVAEHKRLITGAGIKAGDRLIGLASTGLHTNGYSLARAVLLKKFRFSRYIDELGTTLAEALLAVHRSYLGIIDSLKKNFEVKGLAHVTGGGIVGNTARIIPKGLTIDVDWNSWTRPPIFQLIQRVGQVPEVDMRRTFNLGVGLVAVVRDSDAAAVVKYLRRRGEHASIIGDVIKRGTQRSGASRRA